MPLAIGCFVRFDFSLKSSLQKRKAVQLVRFVVDFDEQWYENKGS
jgi:hypothetical protein